MKRPLVTVALFYAAGVLLGEYWPLPLAWLFALSLGIALVLMLRSSMRPRFLALLTVFAGWTNQVTRTAVISPYDLRSLIGSNAEIVTLRGRLCETPDQRVYERRGEESWRTLARLEISALRRGTNWAPASGRVAVTTPGVLGTNFFGGQTVEVGGVIHAPKNAAAEGLFDYRIFLGRQGIYYQLEVETTNDWRAALIYGGSSHPPLADRFRSWSKQTLERGLPTKDESL